MSRDVMVFAGARYDSPLWTNRQQVATRLAERGWRVLYVEPRLLLVRRLADGKWLRRTVIPWRARARLWVFAQVNVFPWSREVAWISAINHRVNAIVVKGWARRLGFRDPVLLLYDTEAAQYLPAFPRARVVYDCVDDHRVQAGVDRNPARVAEEEERIVARADAIAVTTQPLFDRFSKVHRNVAHVPNAAAVERFLPGGGKVGEPEDMTSIPHPRIGTVGALDAYKLDVPLLRAVATARPTWQFILVGPENTVGRSGESVAELHALPNVHFLGVASREDVPAYVHAFDVAIIPYRSSAYNRASFPLKFWEFMASGKPVVASGLPALAPYGHLAALVGTPEAFARAVERALAEPSEARVARMEEAKRHTWDARVSRIEKLLRG